MSFDFKWDPVGFADSTGAEYESPSNYRQPPPVWGELPQRKRASAKRMVVIKPSAKTETNASKRREGRSAWVRDALSIPLTEAFKQLVDEIELKYGAQSNLQRLLFSEEYMAVIGMGPRVVPLLLADLKSGNTPWFWALKAITREDVGSDVGPGDFRSLREAWLSWGASKGLL